VKKEIVFIMSYPWFSLYQRPNHFAHLFKRSGYGVQVVEMRHLVRLNSILNRMNFEEHRRDVDRLWSVVKVPFIGLENIQLMHKIKRILAAREHGTELVFWFQGFDDAIEYDRILGMIPGKKILDVSDSFPDFFTDPVQRQRLEDAEKTVAPRIDAVLTTAQVLYDKFIRYNPRTFLIKNGVDLSRYRDMASHVDPAIAAKIGALSGSPLVCYQGGISSWFDFPLMEAVIRQCFDFTFLFVGMVDIRVRNSFERLCRHRNCHYLGTVGPDVLPWVLSKTDVGIIPFKINDLIRATNPIKLYEYLAAGKPVVATPMIEVMRYEGKGVVATAGDPEAFGALVKEMAVLSSDPPARETRLRIANENTWEARFMKLLEEVPELRQ
jgi:glycosyltransferase involved in cell wall biosynthesis